MARPTSEIMLNAFGDKTVIPAFNASYLPMVEPIMAALKDNRSFGLIGFAMVDWKQFGAASLQAAHFEYQRFMDKKFARLHLDHIPVLDNGLSVDYRSIIAQSIDLGFDSVMVDGSMLDLEENIQATAEIVEIAQAAEVPVEAELGAVMGYTGIPMSYEELFASKKGFTDVDQAKTFAEQTNVDWLSVAVGNIHGALIDAKRNLKKDTARIDIDHLQRIHQALEVPLVLHGGSGISKPHILEAINNGIAKINVATSVRQPYEAWCQRSIARAQQAVYQAACRVLAEDLNVCGSAEIVNPSP